MSATTRRSGAVVLLLLACGISETLAGTFTTYGPRRFPGDVGRSSPIVETFSVADPSAEFLIRVTRRDGTGARIWINGALAIVPDDFVGPDATIERAVVLEAYNEITIAIRRALRGSVTVEIVGIDVEPPTIEATISPAANAAGWHDRDAMITFACADTTAGIATCSTPVAIREEGAGHTVTGWAVDRAGNRATTTATVHLDKTPPVIRIDPVPPGPLPHSAFTISGTVEDSTSAVDTLTCNGMPGAMSGDRFACDLTLALGGNIVLVEAVDLAGNRARSSPLELVHVPIVSDDVVLAIVSPANLEPLGTDDVAEGGVDVRGLLRTGDGLSGWSVTVDAVPATLLPDGSFMATAVPVHEGSNVLTATARRGSTAHTASVLVTLDTMPPLFRIDTPEDGATVTGPTVDVTGRINDLVAPVVARSAARVTVNGIEAAVENGTFVAFDVPVVRGPNAVVARVEDPSGNDGSYEIEVMVAETVGQRLRVVSGTGQSAGVGATLDDCLVVGLVDRDGKPVAGRPVQFAVTRGDGSMHHPDPPHCGSMHDAGLPARQLTALTDDGFAAVTRGDGSIHDTGPPARRLTVLTDDDGLARVAFTLGTRNGVGNQRVTATAPGFDGEAVFVASAETGEAVALDVVSGFGQTGAVGRRLPEPFVVVARDVFGNPVPGVPVRFRVESGEGTIDGEAVGPTGPDGRRAAYLRLGPDEGTNVDVVSASLVLEPETSVDVEFPPEGPVLAFFASALSPGTGPTVVSGVVLDPMDRPLPGATVRIEHPARSGLTVAMTEADGQGRFRIDEGVPVGRVAVVVDGSTGSRPGSWPALRYGLTTVAGADNGLGRPAYLPQLDDASAVSVGQAEATLEMANVPDLAVVVPGTASCPEELDTCLATLTQVHHDKLPLAPPGGASPGLAWTVQPDGLAFGGPATLTVPNLDDLRPGQVVDVWLLDQERGEYVRVGTASVTEDGAALESDPDVGPDRSGWATLSPPPPPLTCVYRCDDGNQCTDDDVAPTCACEHTPVLGDCEDGLFCTQSDSCATGRCVGVPVGDDDEWQTPVIELDVVKLIEKFQEVDKKISDVTGFLGCKKPPFGIDPRAEYSESTRCCESQRSFETVEKLDSRLAMTLGGYVCEYKKKWWILSFSAQAGLRVVGELYLVRERDECEVQLACTTEIGGRVKLDLFASLSISAGGVGVSGAMRGGGYIDAGASCLGECDSLLDPATLDLDTCDFKVEACLGPVSISGKVKLGFIKVGYTFDVVKPPVCATIID